MRHKLEVAGAADFRVDSCGTGGWHCGEAPDPRAIAAARRRGYDISGLRARQFSRADFDAFDVILAMDRSNLDTIRRMGAGRATMSLFLAALEGCARSEVPDPYYGGDDGFDEVLDLIEATCDALLPRLLHVAR